MKASFSIAAREIKSYFVSPTAYVLFSGFLLVAIYFFFNLLVIYNEMLYQAANSNLTVGAEKLNLNQWVVEGYYHTLIVVFLFIVPLLSMRAITEERRRGTFELLLTSPLSVRSIVYGKFLGLAAILFLMTLLAASLPILVYIFSDPEILPLLSGAATVFLTALVFASLSLAISSFTKTQVIAGIISIAVLLLLYVIHTPAEALNEPYKSILNYMSPALQVELLVKGVFSLSNVVYLVSLILLGLFIAERVLDAERWR